MNYLTKLEQSERLEILFYFCTDRYGSVILNKLGDDVTWASKKKTHADF